MVGAPREEELRSWSSWLLVMVMGILMGRERAGALREEHIRKEKLEQLAARYFHAHAQREG